MDIDVKKEMKFLDNGIGRRGVELACLFGSQQVLTYIVLRYQNGKVRTY